MSNLTDGRPDDYEILLMRIYQWYTYVIMGMGIFINIFSLVYMIWKRSQFLFLPYLIGIVLGNLIFLLHLCVLCFYHTSEYEIPEAICSIAILAMSVTQHLPTVYLCIISVERFVKVHKARQIAVYAHSTSCGFRRSQWIRSCLIASFCFCIHLWVIRIARLGDTKICLIDWDRYEDQTWPDVMMLFSLFIDYLLPFTISTVMNLILLRKLKLAQKVIKICVSEADGSMLTLPLTRHCFNKVRGGFPKKKRTVLLFILLIGTDMLLNFPHHVVNLINHFTHHAFSSTFYFVIEMFGYFLWHLQFVISAFIVKIPLFHARKSRRRGGIPQTSNGMASEMISRPRASDLNITLDY